MTKPDAYMQWSSAEAFCREQLRSTPEFDVAGYYYDYRLGWPGLIKSLRSLRGVNIFDAQKEALQNDRWRAWVIRRVNSDPACAKQAKAHIRQWGAAALIALPAADL
ncbi:MAG TPA: hypothetical protein VGV37_09070 [Aliidongia sp.]|uniref:hypothetical protein n=1 Tax=Aliidongia sp. TaxID=1914230 RepID=UPI002DDCF366|nr:hypothetical protein [Aliidongia sp.]HEV2674680.1 hypothetical protein [Aliidongia sp.]